MNITDLCFKYGTDKGIKNSTNDPNAWMHGYSLFYDEIFTKIKDDYLNILDIGGWGANNGGSTKMWRELFINSHIYSCDINVDILTLNTIDRITSFQIDLDNEIEVIQRFNSMNKLFDIVIEDAGHSEKQQCRTLINMSPFMKKDSIYIIEDAPHSINLINSVVNNIGLPYLSVFENYILRTRLSDIKVIKTNRVSTLIYLKFK